MSQNLGDLIIESNDGTVVKFSDPVESGFDIFYKYFIDLLSPLIAIAALWLTIPIIKKKLLENHISKALMDIQDANKKILSDTTDLIDEFLPKTYSLEHVNKAELEVIFEKIKLLYKSSQEGSSDCQTMLFFLKSTLQNTIKNYDKVKNSSLYTREIYGLVIFTLEHVEFFSTQVVQIPKSTKTNIENLINKRIKKYVSHSEFEKYRHFNQGLIDDPNSAHYLIFYNKINSVSYNLLKRSAFQVFWDVSALKKMLYISGIYAPLEVNERDLDSKTTLIGDCTLYLIGFKMSSEHIVQEGVQTKVVDLIYANPSDFFSFVSTLTLETLKSKFKDNFMPDIAFDFDNANKFSHKDIETISLQFDRAYLEKLFNQNRSKLKRKLK